MDNNIIDSLLVARYLREGEETYSDVCLRVAKAIGNTESEVNCYYNAMMNLEFIPNSPTLMNAGTDMGQLSACFTIPVGDSLPEIFDAIKYGALIHQSGGGTGYNFSEIRAEGEKVHSTDGVASGPISFMRVFNSATNVIKQGGRRRGANMGILNVWHPDIMKFVKCKEKEGDFSNFNISVMVSDEFLQMVNNAPNEQWKDTGYTAREIFDAIVDGIWKNGEPGILYYDAINAQNPTPDLGEITITNPCGEQPLLPYESCVLGSINLSKFVHVSETSIIGCFSLNLENTIRMAVRFLNSVIDKNKYPLPQIEHASKLTRKIGLGVMGVHDALLKLGIPYDSEKGRDICRQIMEYINNIAINESWWLAVNDGLFPMYENSTWDIRGIKIRNSAITTIAPTGSISLLARCSSGIEPIFSYAYTRKNTVGKSFDMIHPYFDEKLSEIVPRSSERYSEVIDHLRKYGTIQDIEYLPSEFRKLFKTALDINWKDHIKMQKAFQDNVHASISKTINMPENATKQDIENAIMLAWTSNLKGLTIYRNNSRKDVVLSLDSEKVSEPKQTESTSFERPKSLSGKTYFAQSGCCKLYITVNTNENGKPTEVFIRNDGAGCEATINALGRSISTGLQTGVPYEKYVKQFAKVHCISAIKNRASEGVSCADLIGKCIELTVSNKQPQFDTDKITIKKINVCPECGSVLDFGEGCNLGICKHCGWSGCS